MTRELIIRTVDDKTLMKVKQNTVTIGGESFPLSKLEKSFGIMKRELRFTFFE